MTESLLCTGAVSILGLLILFGFPYLNEICQESGGLTIWPFLLGSLVLRVDLILLSSERPGYCDATLDVWTWIKSRPQFGFW